MITILLQYVVMYLARLKCKMRKRDARDTERKWELFQLLKLIILHDILKTSVILGV